MCIKLNLHRLKAERVANNLSQEELAKKVGKSRAWYAKRENGIVSIGADELVAIAGILNVSDVNIFFTTNVPEKQQT